MHLVVKKHFYHFKSCNQAFKLIFQLFSSPATRVSRSFKTQVSGSKIRQKTGFELTYGKNFVTKRLHVCYEVNNIVFSNSSENYLWTFLYIS